MKKIFLLLILILFLPLVLGAVNWGDREAEKRFEITIGGEHPECINNYDDAGTMSKWKFVNTNGVTQYFDATNDCYDENGIDSEGNSMTECCPGDLICDTDTGRCVDEAGLGCRQLSATECTRNENFHVSFTELEDRYGEDYCGDGGWVEDEDYDDSLCIYSHKCICSINSTNQCNAARNYSIFETAGGRTINSSSQSLINQFEQEYCGSSSSGFYPGNCVLEGDSIVEDNCNLTGFKTVTFYQDWECIGDRDCGDAPSDCLDEEIEVPCLSGALLSFFTEISAVIAIILLIIFYLIVVRKKKKFRKEEENKKIKKKRK